MFEHEPPDKQPLPLFFPTPLWFLCRMCKLHSKHCRCDPPVIDFGQQRRCWFFSILMQVFSHSLASLCGLHTFGHLTHFPHLLLYSRHQHPVDNAGLFSFMTLHWLSPLALKAYRNSSLSVDDVWGLSCHEASTVNCQRWGNFAGLRFTSWKMSCMVWWGRKCSQGAGLWREMERWGWSNVKMIKF